MKLPAISLPLPPADTPPVVTPASQPEKSATRPPVVTVDPDTLRQLADKLSAAIGMAGQQVQFSVDDDTGTTVLRVTDAESGALLRQIPNDEALTMTRILDNMKGLLIRQKA